MASKKSSTSKSSTTSKSSSSNDSSTATKKQREELGAPEGADVGNMKPIEADDDAPGTDEPQKFVEDPSNREAVGPTIASNADLVYTHDTTKPAQNDLQSVYVEPKGKK